ncbi:unnamed protein product [Penicillium roqueforti FM164]|uniref:Genomic scaffold, ProqFM164S03 n=1 Tax=Penicillium roqueforti (strain FM164) TaxID=1365484 RepID=W6QCH7_PENRF|nr:unnamed protein product [Penicillium roqueforti FM164]
MHSTEHHLTFYLSTSLFCSSQGASVSRTLYLRKKKRSGTTVRSTQLDIQPLARQTGDQEQPL